MPQPIYALVDCNSFFVSCERAFQPALRTRPVAVLSGNDGCVISRSAEVKKLGLPMGAPYFKHADFIRQNGIFIFSSNFELYSDMSHRVMSQLKQFSEEMEIYSIDEAFLRLDAVPDPVAYARNIRKVIWQRTRIPVSIGIASSKTLAKAANHWAKDNAYCAGVASFLDEDLVETSGTSPQALRLMLQKIPVQEVWGIGRNFGAFLQDHGVRTAADFAYADQGWIRKHMGIVGVRLAQELQGISCDAGVSADPKHSIMCTRSFGRAVSDIVELREALAMHAAQAAEKLRDEGEVCGRVGVLLRTSRHTTGKKYAAVQYMDIETPTQFTPELSKYALRILDTLYKPGFAYAKVGVFCERLLPETACQQSLFERKDVSKERSLMDASDRLNRKFGSGTLRYAQSGITRAWKAKRGMLSQAFTTRLGELPIVK